MPSKLKKVFRPGESKTLTLEITNRADRRQPVNVKLHNVPDDWTVVADQEDLVLDAGADGRLTVSIRAPDKIEKEKIGMRLETIPEFSPDKRSEIKIQAKLKPTREQLREARGGGLLFGGSDDEDEEAEPVQETATGTSVVTASTREPASEPDEIVEYRYAPHITAGGVYHVTHVPVGNGTVLKVREQVRLLCRLCGSRNVCFEGKFHEHMDRETFLQSDHCLIEEGDFD